MTFGQRLKQIRAGKSQAKIAELLGIPQTTWSNYENDKNKPDFDLLERICSEFRLNSDWLLFGRGPMHLGNEASALAQPALEGEDTDLVLIPRVAARLAAGTGSLETDGDVLGMYAFREDWIRKKGNPKRMVLMDVTGDSMTPKIEHGDMVLIDQGKTDILGYGFFAVGIDDAVFVKQLRVKPGKLILHSLNPDYEDIEVDMAADQPQDVRIIGRVLWVARELD